MEEVELFEIRFITDQWTDYEDDYSNGEIFEYERDAERFAEYLNWRDKFEYHEEMWHRPVTYYVKKIKPTAGSFQQARNDYEEAHGAPKSGEDRLAEKRAEGKRHEMIMINKTQWDEFKDWKAAQIDGNTT